MTSYSIDYINKNYLNFIFLDEKTMEDIQEELQAELIQEMDLRNKNVFRIIVHLSLYIISVWIYCSSQ